MRESSIVCILNFKFDNRLIHSYRLIYKVTIQNWKFLTQFLVFYGLVNHYTKTTRCIRRPLSGYYVILYKLYY